SARRFSSYVRVDDISLDTAVGDLYSSKSLDDHVNRKEQEMEATTSSVRVVSPSEGQEGFLGSIGVRFMIDGPEAGERFTLVEHAMSPRALAAPLHLHTCEDEYSYVLEGRMGALLGDEV